MKQHLSVLMLITRSSIYKVIAVLIAMAAAQAGVFGYVLHSNLQGGIHHLESMVSSSGIAWVFAAAFLLLTYVISRTGCKNGSQPGYTIQHSLPPKSAPLTGHQTLLGRAAHVDPVIN